MESFEILYEKKIDEANMLINELHKLKHVKGISKLKKLILSERSFLQKIAASEKKTAKHLATTNLTHFGALVSAMLDVENCVSVLEPFTFEKDGIPKRIVVDIVKNQGLEWIKVTARNPKSLMMSCIGDSSYGSRTILEQAEDFIQCAHQNHVLYSAPKITFKFSVGVDVAVACKIKKLGIQVDGELYPTMVDITDYSDEENEESIQEQKTLTPRDKSLIPQVVETQDFQKETIKKLNLDTTALIAYVSDMTNGSKCATFMQEPLTLQAEAEKNTKVKESLDNLFEDKELFACETAMSRFQEIVNTVGGEQEKARAKLLIEKVTVVPDCVSERVKKLKLGGQVKERPLVVFGTGDSMQALTVSANWGFCRSAKHQGVHLATFLHEPRALSEQASNISLSNQEKNKL